MTDHAGAGARGERSGGPHRVGPLVILAVVLVGLAIAVTVGLIPHRAERAITTRLRAVSVWNAIEHRCQLENRLVDPHPYTCGAYELPLHRSLDAPSRRLVALSSGHDNCVIDEDTLEAFACRDTRLEWASVGAEVVSVASLHPNGTRYVITQQHLVTRELRAIDVPFSQWFDRSDPHEVRIVEEGPDGRRVWRVGFGALEPLESP
ncbi:MAG: hypothetical protein J0L92_10495 [Deltaproteobacteria bacterium]|nr:hypothetical protein [Deltaproteobacteria bacterium]